MGRREVSERERGRREVWGEGRHSLVVRKSEAWDSKAICLAAEANFFPNPAICDDMGDPRGHFAK